MNDIGKIFMVITKLLSNASASYIRSAGVLFYPFSINEASLNNRYMFMLWKAWAHVFKYVLKSSVNTLRERVWLKHYTFLKMIHGLLYFSYRGRCAKEYWFSFQSQTILDLVWGYYPIIFFTFLLGTLKKKEKERKFKNKLLLIGLRYSESLEVFK